MATEMDIEHRETTNNVMILLTDPEGTPLGAPMYLPQNAGPQQLQQMVNKLLIENFLNSRPKVDVPARFSIRQILQCSNHGMICFAGIIITLRSSNIC
ncbi:notchless protein-like protein [Cucumis melo var. makuwa]|uniref:Notchless protein-like protein n=1 Tax=Cucumis melo var. makuwa TaxID=1194695 RepID=A0A5D3BKP5_CUCMM|nr:notchless protein-like protein [Cucumis melo var. makuwa]TYJ99863.1 notchless protein-like protein [Cucumis melo var. makuwa]